MFCKGNRVNNAPIESFSGILKNDLIYYCCYYCCRRPTKSEAEAAIREYVRILYNGRRPTRGWATWRSLNSQGTTGN